MFTEVQSAEINMDAKVRYIGYRPTYCTICNIHTYIVVQSRC